MTRAPEGLRSRLVPLYAAAFLQAFALWVPIEKLFMITIGFDAASVGLMAGRVRRRRPDPGGAVGSARGN